MEATRSRTEAVDEVIPEVYAKAIREHDVEPVERPKFEIVEETGGRPTRLKATVEVRPTIVLGAYKGVVVSRPPSDVTEVDVDRSLEALAKERATLVPVERPTRLGDVVTLDYEGFVEGKPFEGGRGEGQIVELDEGRFVPGFAAGIVGMLPGQTKQIEVRFPDEYPAAELAGKEAAVYRDAAGAQGVRTAARLTTILLGASRKTKRCGQLREDLRRRLEAVAAGRARRAVGNAIMTQLLAAHDFPLPPSMVENELNRLVEEAQRAAPEGRSR